MTSGSRKEFAEFSAGLFLEYGVGKNWRHDYLEFWERLRHRILEKNPTFADFGEGMVRIGQVSIVGNSTRKVDTLLPKQPKKVALNADKDVLER